MQVKASITMTAFFVAVGALVACGDSTGVETFENIEANITVYALTGSAPNAPSSFSIVSPAAKALTPAFDFDVAFDINPANEIVVYTPRALANQLASVARVGFQQTTQTFAEVTQAPTSGFVYDTSMVIPVNKTVLVDASNPNCQFSLSGSTMKAKFAVDSVDFTKRAMYVHVLSDYNCGFKSLTTGTPKG